MPVATPTFSPVAGSYTGTQSVTISDATSGAACYYTLTAGTTGTTPTTSSTAYSSAISVTATSVLEALCSHSGDTNSAVASAAYTITVPTPTFSPVAGSYTSAQSVSISDATSSTTCYYTLTAGTTGTPPTTSSTRYTGAISVAVTSVLESLCTFSGDTNSASASATYTIPLSVTVSPATAGVSAGGTQQFTATVVGSTNTAVNWTLSPTTGAGSINTTSGLYTAPTTVTTPQTVTITATSQANTSVKATATLTLKATPTLSVASSSNPSTYGGSVTFTATISSGPTGTVTFYDSGTSIGTGTISGTKATFTTTSLGAGAHTITAGYGGNTSYSAVTSSAITQTVNKATPTLSVASSSNPSTYGGSVTFTATISSGPTGTVTFYDGGTSIGTGTISGTTATYATTTLAVGAHTITAGWAGNTNYGPVTSSAINQTVNLPAAPTPTFSPAAGPYLNGSEFPVTISDSNTGATIYYTTDGTNPLSSSTASVYTVPIPVSPTETLEAAAKVSGYANSAVATALYMAQTAPPTFSPVAGSYVGPQTLTLSDVNSSELAIYYTAGTPGTTPTIHSTPYTSPITVSSSETVEAIANSESYATSQPASATYTITSTVTAPVFTPPAGTYSSAQLVTIGDSSSLNATIYYTTNGVAPTTSSAVYSRGSAITVSSTETLEALAVVPGYTSPPAATATYTLPAIANSTTALAVTSGGSPVTTVPSNTVVTLTATVASSATAVSPGTVNFCNASVPATPCTDIHLLGTAQLTSAGIATIKIQPGIGSHSYCAIFVGTSSYATSTSSTAQLTVPATGSYTTATTISAINGAAGNYTLTAQVTGMGNNTVAPTGQVSIQDTTNANAVLGTAQLSGASKGITFANVSTTSFPETEESYPGLTVVGDFNGDGKPDLAVFSNYPNNGVTVLLGNGQGGFNPATESFITTPLEPNAIVVGDFNGDGNLDLAVLSDWGTVTTLLGKGDGTFALSNNQSSGCTGGTLSGPTSLAVADFNRDGKLDLAVTCIEGGPGENYDAIILLGNGDGTFTQSNGSQIPLTNNPSFVTTGDFNGDGIPDLAVLSEEADSITILLSNGDGTFTPRSPIAAGNNRYSDDDPYSLAVGDFYGNGHQDLAVADWYNYQVMILQNDGSGNFPNSRTFGVGGGPFAISVGDFNQDGIPDLAVANNVDGTITILLGLGDGNGSFLTGDTVSAGGPPNGRGTALLNGPWSLAAGDFNGDGIPDLAWVSLDGTSTSSTVNILQTNLSNTATATFTNIAPAGSGTHYVDVSYGGDINDLASTSATTPLQAVPNAMSASLVPMESQLGSPVAVNIALFAQNGAMPTGTVSCSGAGVTSAPVTLNPNGSATVPMNGLPLGSDAIVCSFLSNNSGRFSNAASSTMIESVSVLPGTGTVIVNPVSATLYAGQTMQFGATVLNTGNQTVTWTVSPSGAGTITATGLYVAPAIVTSPQTIAVTAISQANTSQSATAMITLSPPQYAASGYSYQRTILIDHTKVPNTDQADFPFLFNTTDPAFKTTGNGGHVSNSSGYDIIFSMCPYGDTKLDHELEQYNPATGQVVAWVRIPNLSHITDTVLYVFYGNANVTTPQQNPTGVWDSNHTGVYHLANVGTGIAADSTANGNNGTLTPVPAASGQVYGGAGLNGVSSYLQIPSTDFPAYPISGSTTTGFSASFETWFQTGSAGVILGQTDGTEPGGNPGGWQPALYIDNAGRLRASVFSHGSASDQIVTATPYNDNNWHFAADTYTNGTEELYIDGQAAGSQQVAEAGYNSAYAYFVGTGETANWLGGNGSWLYFNGGIDEVNVSNVARSGDWVQTQYNNQSSPSAFYALYPENTEEAVPATVSLRASQSQQFSVLGSAVVSGSWSPSTVIWSMPSGSPGTLTAEGLYTAPNSIDAQQTVTITGTTLGDSPQSITTTVTLIPAATVAVSVTPGSMALSSGQTQQFTSSVSNSGNTAVTWTIDPAGVGSFSAPGLYTAPASVTAQQTVIITATSQADPTQSSSVVITLLPPLMPVTVSVNPSRMMLSDGSLPQQLTVTVGNTSNTAVTWSISPTGGGTISASGLYTAPASIASQQTVTLTATSVADPTKSATVTVTLLPILCGSNGYSYQRAIVIDHTKVPNTDQTSFPVLISGTYPFLATAANGGRLQNANGYDIVFSSDPNGQNLLDYEIDSYNGQSGAAAYWVRIPILSHTADTTLYMWYGNPSITGSQENKPGVWSNGYAGVWHFGTPSALSTADSTINANNGINNGVAPTSGIIGGAGTFDGSGSTYLDIPSNASFKPGTAITLEAWVNMTAITTSPVIYSLDYRADGNWYGVTDAYALNFGSNSSSPGMEVAVNGVQEQNGLNENSIPVGQWTHIVGTYDGSNLITYVNDAAVATSPQNGPIDYGASQDLDIGIYTQYGAVYGYPEGAINGLIDEARISSVARSADWIATEYNNESSPSIFYTLSAENAVEVSPASVNLYASQSEQFTFELAGSCNSAVTWSVPLNTPGILTASGLYTAPASIGTPQTVVITATSTTNSTNSASATVTLMPPVAVSVTPANPTLYEANQPLQFTVSVANTSNTTVSWTISPAGTGTISSTGLYIAPASVTTQQTVTITATSLADMTKSATVTVTLSPTQCVSNGYIYQHTIVIDHTKVPNTDQTNFPFLFNTTDPVFKSTANGGQVMSPNGYDIIFSSDPNGLTKLDHELEEYNPVTGQIIAWIRIPTLSHTADTVLYVFYGNPNIISSQQNPVGAWDSNYQAVYHLANTGMGVAADSTAYANNGTLTSVAPASGEIYASVGGAAGFNGTSSFIQIPQADFPSYPTAGSLLGTPTSGQGAFIATFGVWFKTASAGGILSQSPNPDCYYFVVCLPVGNPEPGDWDPPQYPLLYVDDNGRLEVNNGGFVSPAAYNDNNWHYAAITYAGNETATLYVDGQSVASQQAPQPAYSPNYVYYVGTAYTWLSDLGNSNWLYFNGSIDDVSVSNIPRSGDWIQTEYNNQGSPSTFYTFNPSSSIQVVPSAISLYGSQSQRFAATATCSNSVAWSMPAGAPGALTSSGLYTAPDSITTTQTVTITATNQASGTTMGSSVVTLLPPPLPITLAAAVQPPYITGNSQAFTATLKDQYGNPQIGVAVTFSVNGANNDLGSVTTDGSGVASYTYNGANSGNDTIQATAVFDGQLMTSNGVSVSWIVPAPLNPDGSIALMAPTMLGQAGLIGAFTDSTGALIEPIAIGATTRTFVVPAGATQLQLGIDDDHYADNGGSGFVVEVNNGAPVTVPPTAMPWNWVTGGLNNNYQYAMNDGTSPVVAATGLTHGQSVSIAYQSGTVSANFPTSPLVNADGDQTQITGVQLWQGTYYPTLYTTLSSYPVGQPIQFATLVTNSSGTPMANVPVTLDVMGANVQQLQATTDSTGAARFLYSGSNAGTDNLQAQAFPSGEGNFVSGQTSVTWAVYAPPPSAGTLTFSNQLILGPSNGQGYIVVAQDASGNPAFDANVGFYVSGVNVLSQGGTTDINGQVPFGFNHNPGAYSIVAVDSVGRNVTISNPITGVWTPPTTTNPPGYSITVGISAPSMVTMPNALQLNGTATDNLGINITNVVWSQVSGPGAVTFTNQNQLAATATFSEIGSYVVQLTATDSMGNSGSLQFPVTVLPAQQNPQGWIGSPAYGTAVSGVVPIMLAPGVTLQSGTLVYYPANNPNSVTTLSATIPNTGQQIATLDTTTLPNGTYWIQLQATNTSGQAQYSLVLVTIVGSYKPGRVTATVTDLVVPATGLAIDIQRRYDSLNASTSSDFGYGWALGFNVNLTVDPAGDVTFTLGGQRKTFYLTPQMPSCTVVGCLVPYDFPVFTPEPGLHGTLTDSGSNCNLDIVVPNGSTWACQSGGQYTPTGYIYTDPNGTAYNISASGNLQSIQDLSGNGLTITANGITSTTGLSVPFVRDSSNRITQITDPAGNIYQYAYDVNGNLASVTYPNTAPTNPTCAGATAPNTSTYTYNSSHLYTGGTDALCHLLPTSTYYPGGETDANGNSLTGRLQSVTDALGNTTSYAYNLSATSTINGVSVPNTGVTTITYPADASGHTGTATMVYDSFGDLLQSTDPNDLTTVNTYDANHNLISVTDPLGHTNSYTYDANGNKTSSTYPTTATSTNTTSTTYYNQYSAPTSTTDELGNVRTFNYDTNYSPKSITDSIGTLASFIFNANRTFGAGAIGFDITASPAQASQFTYDANGNMASRTDALGRTTSYVYNSLGQKLSMTAPTPASPTGSAASTTTYQYDALGNLIQTAAPLGRTTSSIYDANRNKISSTDARGNTTNYVYDVLNRLIEIDYPSNASTPATKSTRSYDFRSNVIDEIDQAGNDTHHIYDPAGRQISVTRDYGSTTTAPSTTSYTYYNDGRIYTETDPAGNVITYTYDNAGRVIEVANASGNVQFGYDNAGNQISMTDPRGNTTQFQYDARKRLVKTTYPDADSTTKTNVYDGPGNLISVTDQAGNVVQYTYNAANELQTVVQKNSPNTSNNTNSYSYDNLGNLTGLTDENLHTTQNAFDVLSEPVKKALPDNTLYETRAYDADGNLYQLTHFNGVTTTYAYDALNRLLSRTTPGETTVSFTYTPNGQRATMTDASGQTTYTYDSLNRLITKVTPEGTLSYTYYPTGSVNTVTSSNTNGVSVSYTYDDLNRLSTVVDNRLSGANTTTYTYDSASNVARVAYPSGLTSTSTYDPLNRLTELSTSLSASQITDYKYTLGAIGNRTNATELSGRILAWSYDGIYRLTNEAITSDPSNNNDGSVSYILDPVGNRTSDTSSLAGVSPQSASYNPDDQLSIESYDNNGNATGIGIKSFTYDSENHMVTMTNGSTSVTLLYDGDGNRVAKTVNGVTTRYLVDTLNPTGYAQVVEETVNGVVQRQYTYGRQRISENQVIQGAWTPSFYEYDGGGSVRQLTNSAGQVTDSYEYDAFGNQIHPTATTPNNYLYRGEQYDPDLSIYYLRARYYNPSTGRFLSRDPLDGDPTDPQSLHKYLYAGGDPVNRIDPSGRADSIETIFTITVIATPTEVALSALAGQATAAIALLQMAAGQAYLTAQYAFELIAAAGEATGISKLLVCGAVGLAVARVEAENKITDPEKTAIALLFSYTCSRLVPLPGPPPIKWF